MKSYDLRGKNFAGSGSQSLSILPKRLYGGGIKSPNAEGKSRKILASKTMAKADEEGNVRDLVIIDPEKVQLELFKKPPGGPIAPRRQKGESPSTINNTLSHKESQQGAKSLSLPRLHQVSLNLDMESVKLSQAVSRRKAPQSLKNTGKHGMLARSIGNSEADPSTQVISQRLEESVPNFIKVITFDQGK